MIYCRAHLKSAITVRRGASEDVHAAKRVTPIGWGGKVSIVHSGPVLDGKPDGVTAMAALAEVIRLEVVRSFGEAVLVCQIVNL